MLMFDRQQLTPRRRWCDVFSWGCYPCAYNRSLMFTAQQTALSVLMILNQVSRLVVWNARCQAFMCALPHDCSRKLHLLCCQSRSSEIESRLRWLTRMHCPFPSLLFLRSLMLFTIFPSKSFFFLSCLYFGKPVDKIYQTFVDNVVVFRISY